MNISIFAEDFEKYRLDAEARDDCAFQVVPDSVGGASTWKTWERKKLLGQGAFGEVWQEECKDKHGDWHYRAIKVCSKRKMQAAQVDYRRELSALAAFSRSEV